MAKKVIRKRRVRKNIPQGVAHIHSTFNNTIVTITCLLYTSPSPRDRG